MKLSTKSEYAFLALIECASVYPEGRLRIAEISEKRKIPLKYLENIVNRLRLSGYINSKRGVNGGVSLAKSPQDISLAEIIRLMDGALAPTLSVSTYFYEKTPLEQSEKFISLLKEIRDHISDRLEATSIADITPQEKI